MLADHPTEVIAAHRDFLESGAKVAISCTYQLSYEGGRKVGLDAAGVDRLARQSIELARSAAADFPDDVAVLTSVGPYGAMLADGSEYNGDYGITTTELTDWHRNRLQTLVAAGGDGLAIETIPSLQEVEAIVAALADFEVEAWLCITPEHGTTRTGESLEEVFKVAASAPQIVAVGVNCCHPQEVSAAVAAARSSTDKPFLAYPNAGGHWDVKRQAWFDDGGFPHEAVSTWLADGVAAIGGCCRVTPADIAAIAATAKG